MSLSNLLCEHHVARDEATFRHKAPPNFGVTRIIQLMDVHLGAIEDSVSPSGDAPDDIKVAVSIKLFELRRRKPGVQKAQTTSMRVLFIIVVDVKSTQRFEA